MDEITALKNIIDFLVEDMPVESLPKVDAIFLFGHIDPRVPKHAARLFQLGKAQKIIVSGKGRKIIPGYNTEADYFASVLKEAGVPGEAMILEENAMNTLENVQFGIKQAADIGFYPKSLILIAIPPMLKRTKATMEKHFPDIVTYGSTFQMPMEEYRTWAKRLVEEFSRFEPYAEKGDIMKIEVPEEIRKSVDVLRGSSFIKSSSPHFYAN